jgi:hypothetical protein
MPLLSNPTLLILPHPLHPPPIIMGQIPLPLPSLHHFYILLLCFTFTFYFYVLLLCFTFIFYFYVLLLCFTFSGLSIVVAGF